MNNSSVNTVCEEESNSLLFWGNRNFLLVCCSFALVLFIAGIFAPMGVDWHHDGFLYKPAEDLANGKVPYRDTFVLHGFFTTAFHSLILKYIAPRLILLRYSAAIFYAFAGALFYLSWRRFLPDTLAFFSVLLYICLMPFWLGCGLYAWSSVYVLPFYGLILLSGYKLLDQPDNIKQGTISAVLMAVFSIIIWQFREPAGIFNCFCLLLFWPLAALAGFLRWKQALRYGLVYSGVCLTGVIIFFVWLGYLGAFNDWYLQTKANAIKEHVQGFGGQPGFGGTITHIYQCLVVSQPIPYAKMEPIWLLFPLVCGMYLLKTFLPIKEKTASKSLDDDGSLVSNDRKCQETDQLKPSLLLMALVGCGSCLQYYPVCCFVHCAWGAAVAIGLLVYAFWSFVGKRTDFVSMAVFGLLLGFVFTKAILIDRIPVGVERAYCAFRNEPLRFPLAVRGIHPTERKEVNLLPLYGKAMEIKQEHPDIPMTAIIQSPMLWYLLPESFCPDAVFVSCSRMEQDYPERWKHYKDYIDQNKPIILIDEAILESNRSLLHNYQIVYASDLYALTNCALFILMDRNIMTDNDKQMNQKIMETLNNNLEKRCEEAVQESEKIKSILKLEI